MIVVDASVWISSLIESELEHETSRSWLQSWTIAKRRISVPTLLLSEVGGAVTRRTNDKNLGNLAVESILGFPRIQIVELDARLAVESARIAIDCALRGADAAYVALASRLDVPLVTWDQEQLSRAVRMIKCHNPPPLPRIEASNGNSHY